MKLYAIFVVIDAEMNTQAIPKLFKSKAEARQFARDFKLASFTVESPPPEIIRDILQWANEN